MDLCDRCDRCGARAYVRITIPVADKGGKDLALKFCNHHYGEHAVGLAARGARVTTDERADLVSAER